MSPELLPKSDGPKLFALVDHALKVGRNESVSNTYQIFQNHHSKFIAVVENGKPIGIVSRGHIGFLLGSQFGYSVYFREFVFNCVQTECLIVHIGETLHHVLAKALSRGEEFFHDDVVLADENGFYLGLIPVCRLANLQSSLLHIKMDEISKSSDRYQSLFENHPFGLALIERSGFVATCNNLFFGSLGLDIIPVPCHIAQLVNGPLKVEIDRLLVGTVNESEIRCLIGTRGSRDLKLSMTGYDDRDQACLSIEDVTEKRMFELQMVQKEKHSMLETLVGGIAHEINNKLSPIVGFTELLLEQNKTVANPLFLRSCSVIRDCALDSAKIIRQLLNLSKPLPVDPVPGDLRTVVDETHALLRMSIREQTDTFRKELPSEKVMVRADMSQVKQVLINLVLNALQAMSGKPHRSLEIEIEETDGWASINVRDSGIGITTADMNRIFEPFFTTKGQTGGNGLGLTICYGIINRHNGRINVRSEPGLGTTFTVMLPLHLGLEEMPLPEQPKMLPRDEEHALQKVLVVDDEVEIQQMIKDIFTTSIDGITVVTASDGAEAITRLVMEDFDLVLSDIRMPGKDGMALLDWIEMNRPELRSRLMFITGDEGRSEVSERLQRAKVPQIRKPFSMLDLVEKSLNLARNGKTGWPVAKAS